MDLLWIHDGEGERNELSVCKFLDHTQILSNPLAHEDTLDRGCIVVGSWWKTETCPNVSASSPL
jgi:hypothetical protein